MDLGNGRFELEAELAECCAERDRLSGEVIRIASAWTDGGLGPVDAMKQVRNLAADMEDLRLEERKFMLHQHVAAENIKMRGK